MVRNVDPSLVSCHKGIYLGIKLFRVIKYMPYAFWNMFKGFFESFRDIFLVVVDLSDAGHLADVDGTHPLGVFPIYFTIGLRIALGAVSNADELALGKPLVNLFHAADLVRLSSLCKIGKESPKIHPRGVTEDQSACRVVCFAKLPQKRIEVVG